MFGNVTFNKVSASIARFMANTAPSLRAQLLREIPLFTSQKSIDFKRCSASKVPSRSIPKPPLITSPQPTPPPLWIETQVAPRKLSPITLRSEEHTSELQSRENIVCRLLLEKKKTIQ